jgi:hypothetical protein
MLHLATLLWSEEIVNVTHEAAAAAAAAFAAARSASLQFRTLVKPYDCSLALRQRNRQRERERQRERKMATHWKLGHKLKTLEMVSLLQSWPPLQSCLNAASTENENNSWRVIILMVGCKCARPVQCCQAAELEFLHCSALKPARQKTLHYLIRFLRLGH